MPEHGSSPAHGVQNDWAQRESAHIDARLAILAELASPDAPPTTPDAASQRWQALPASRARPDAAAPACRRLRINLPS